MGLQTIQFETISLAEVGSGTVTAFLYSGTTLVATLSSITENGTLRGRYTGTTLDVPAATYRVVIKFNGITISEPTQQVVLLLATGTYVVSSGVAGDATAANQDTIIGLINNYASSALAGIEFTPGVIMNFPTTLNIGDSYTDATNSSIHVFIRDANDVPITSVGDFDFLDAEFEPEVVITQSGTVGRVKATVSYVDPGAAESYLNVEIPSSQSRRASPGAATVQCILRWVDTDGKVLAQKTLSMQAVTWNEMV
jgi:hypothetical protein